MKVNTKELKKARKGCPSLNGDKEKHGLSQASAYAREKTQKGRP